MTNVTPLRRDTISEALAALRIAQLKHENKAERLEAIERALKAAEEAMCVRGGIR